ncbi:MAG: hypothetical protein ACOCYP_07850 [Planctomycetota bacterium]
MYDWGPYVSVAERLANARAAMRKRAAAGHPVDPIRIEGRTIARTPWGKAWCDNMESYSDFSNRLPRGRRYARNGSVVDLQLQPGRIDAYIAGSKTYHASISVTTVEPARWRAMCTDCGGGIDSLVELLQGRLDQAVMQRLCRQNDGLFPTPRQFRFSCSCPDCATMCKHVAAVLYGVGNRLDHRPELLFTLRGVDPADLIASAGTGLATAGAGVDSGRIIEDDGDLGSLFGLDLDDDAAAEPSDKPARTSRHAGTATKRGTRHTTPSGEAVPSRSRQAGVPSKTVGKRRNRGQKASRTTQRAAPPPTTPAPRSRDLYGRLYRRLAKAGSLTSAEAQTACDATATELRPQFKRLLAEGHATVTGKTRGTTYHINI